MSALAPVPGFLSESVFVSFNLINKACIFRRDEARGYIAAFRGTAEKVTDIVFARVTLIGDSRVDCKHTVERIITPLSIEEFEQILNYPKNISNADWMKYIRRIANQAMFLQAS